MTDLQHVLLAAHQANVSRYHRILGTHLTDFEREFVEHRLYEEEDAIRRLVGCRRSSTQSAAPPTEAARSRAVA